MGRPGILSATGRTRCGEPGRSYKHDSAGNMPAGPTVKMAVLPNLSVRKRIQELSVLEHIVLQSPLQCEAALFQNARRSEIVRIRLCIDPMERKFYEALVYECWDHFRHYAVSPKFLTQPKAEFDDMSMDVLTNANTDAANRRLTDVDTKICHGLLRCCAAQEFICVVDRMGAGTNRAGQARRGDCLHASRATPHHRDATREWCTARARVDQSVLGKFNSGFLHFAIWQ